MVNKDGTIKYEKEIKGNLYRVFMTKKGSAGIWSARDIIKNVTTGEKKEKTRREWRDLFNKFYV